MLVVGSNTLYINATDQGGPASLIFSATITTDDIAAVPEPATITMLGIGIAGMAGYGWRRRKPHAVMSGTSFRDYIINLLASSQPLPTKQ